jgi:hypothetical protein
MTTVSHTHLSNNLFLDDLWAFALGLHDDSPAASGRPNATAGATDALQDAVEHGYLDEESGKTVTIPRFARAMARTSLITGGWV